jgi:hypothetical protein
MNKEGKILDKIIEILKTRKIAYTFDNDLFELSVSSTFEGYIQLEKQDSDVDYTIIVTYIRSSDYNDEELMVQHYDDFEFDAIDEMVNGLIEDIKSTTKAASKITLLFDKISEIMNDCNIGENMLNNLYYDCLENLE